MDFWQVLPAPKSHLRNKNKWWNSFERSMPNSFTRSSISLKKARINDMPTLFGICHLVSMSSLTTCCHIPSNQSVWRKLYTFSLIDVVQKWNCFLTSWMNQSVFISFHAPCLLNGLIGDAVVVYSSLVVHWHDVSLSSGTRYNKPPGKSLW